MLIFNTLLVSTSNVSSPNFTNIQKPSNKHTIYLYSGLIGVVATLIAMCIKGLVSKATSSDGLSKHNIILISVCLAIILVIFVNLAKNQDYYTTIAKNLLSSEQIFNLVKMAANKYSKNMHLGILSEGTNIGNRLILFDNRWYFDISGINNHVEFLAAVVKAAQDGGESAARGYMPQLDVQIILEQAVFFNRKAIRYS